MITTTLNKIRDHEPCLDRWEILLKHLGKTKADDKPLPFATIVESNGLDDALWFCRAAPEHDKEWRLFAVWCARQVENLMVDERSIKALDVAEAYAYGNATDYELAAAWDAAWAASISAARDAARDAAWAAAIFAARAVASDAAWAASMAAASDAADAAADAAARAAAWDAAWDAAMDAARDAARDEAWAASMAASMAAAMDAQTKKFLEIVGEAQ